MLEKFRTQIKYVIKTLEQGTDDPQLKGQLKGLNTKILGFIKKMLTEEMNQPKMYKNWLLGLNQAAGTKTQREILQSQLNFMEHLVYTQEKSA